jgi:ribose-phosphate pyrophosphokinase
MELLLSIAAAKRAGAASVTAVIPYFGYKHSRRGLPISTTNHSRFLWNAAGDLAKMLQISGVDKVISVDLQRPGQGHEACFFNSGIPAETISTNNLFVKFFSEEIALHDRVVIVSPNTINLKKAIKFQRKLQVERPESAISHSVFLRDNVHEIQSQTSLAEAVNAEMLGGVSGADVVIMTDTVGSGKTLVVLSDRLLGAGARRVFVCASHGLLTDNALANIDQSRIEKVVISDSVQIQEPSSPKIVQLSLSNLLAKIIESDGERGDDIEFSDNQEDDLGNYEIE